MGPAYHPFLAEGALLPYRVVAALHLALVAVVMLLLVEVGLWPYPMVQALLLEAVELRPYQAGPLLVVLEEVESQLGLPLPLQVLEFEWLPEQGTFLPAQVYHPQRLIAMIEFQQAQARFGQGRFLLVVLNH